MVLSNQRRQRIDVQKAKIHMSEKVENFMPKPIIFSKFNIFFDFPNLNKGESSLDKTTSSIQDNERYYDLLLAKNYAIFGGAVIVKNIKDANIIICSPAGGIERLDAIRADMAANYTSELRHVVGTQWVLDCWKEETILDFDSKLAINEIKNTNLMLTIDLFFFRISIIGYFISIQKMVNKFVQSDLHKKNNNNKGLKDE
jgi:hypothetical protein